MQARHNDPFLDAAHSPWNRLGTDAGVKEIGEDGAIGGVLRQRDEDFLVEEIPLYELAGEGEHICLFVEKHGLSTRELVRVLAKHFGVRSRDVGYAGLKDTHAMTRQLISIYAPGKSIESFPSLAHEHMAILWADQHTNKLRLGHLQGNRFSIRVREVPLHAVLKAKKTLERLAEDGLANIFGYQRFGMFGTNHAVGRSLVRGDAAETLSLLLGPTGEDTHSHESATHNENIVYARELFAQEHYADAAARLPRSMRTEKNILESLARGASAAQALGRLDRHARAMYLSAFQAAIFNRVVALRAAQGTLGTLIEGDCAYMHASHKTFMVTQAELDDPEMQQRIARIEVSPSGPMWGVSMRRASGKAGQLEDDALTEAGVDFGMIERFAKSAGKHSLLEGARRPLRVPVIDPDIEGGVDVHGSYVRCAFELPRGSFATVVMEQIMGSPLAQIPTRGPSLASKNQEPQP